MRRRFRRAPDQPVYRITGARPSVSADVDVRQRRYLIAMSIRTACFVLAVFTPGWWRAVFLVGAIVLPYVSVVVANGGRERTQDVPPVAPIGEPVGQQIAALPRARPPDT